MFLKRFVRKCWWRNGVLWGLLLCPLVGHTAPAIRFTTQPPDDLSSASRFNVGIELFETSNGLRLLTTGVNVNLALFRCPGHPSACTPVAVDPAFASGSTVLGGLSFSGLVVEDDNADYYLSATASGYQLGVSSVFDVNPARMRIDTTLSSSLSTASRTSLQVSIRNGTAANAPVDTRADGIALRLALFACPGSPGPCTPTSINADLANGVAQDGVLTFNNVVLNSAGEDRYLALSAPSHPELPVPAVSNVVDVLQAGLRFDESPSGVVSTASRLPLRVSVTRGTTAGAPVDPLADNINLRLSLFACPGHPNPCTPTSLDPNVSNQVAQNGTRDFSNISVASAGNDRYFQVSAPSHPEIAGIDVSDVFDVEGASLFVRPIPAAAVSTASRIPLQVEVRRGSGPSAPLDTLAHGVGIRLGRYTCPGHPMPCTVSTLTDNFANAPTSSGVASFQLSIDSVALDQYFGAYVPGMGGILLAPSEVFDVQQATLRVESPLSVLFAGLGFPLDAAIRAGTAVDAPIDVLADGHVVRLALYSCIGFPMACTPSPLDLNFANASAVDGIASFNGLVIPVAGPDRYFFPQVPVEPGIDGEPSAVFDVLDAPDDIFEDGFEDPP